jgi:hypothetical protein
MKKIIFTILITIVIIVSNFYLANATHVAGADITYENVGVDSFLVTVNIFEDCGGSATLGATITVQFVNTCGIANFSSSFPQTDVSEVSQLCDSEQPNSTCNGGSLPGMLQKTYQKIVVLAQCENWKINWGIANRNASVNLDPAGNTLFFAVNAFLNNFDAPTNNSPKFNSQPIPYVCANQLVNYSFGVSEQDGDSLAYSFADPLGGTAANPIPLTYQPGFTTLQPLPGIVIDPITGLLTFTPTALGSFVVVTIIEEYRNGVFIGFVKRDIQFIVRSCINTAPDFLVGEITNLNGDAVQTSPYALEICEGNTFTFAATFTDQNPLDTLQIFTNLSTVLPGSILNTIGTNPLTIFITWTAPAGSSGQNNSFTVTVNDNTCPIPGTQNYVYSIDVVPSTFIIPSLAELCLSDSVQLQAIGGSDFIWYDISGTQIAASNEFSCNNCPNPVAKPTVTTSYIVESNLIGSCLNKDTIVVTVNPLPTQTLISANGATSICDGAVVTLGGNTNGGTWSTGATTSSINVNAAGNYFVTNTNSCGSVNSNIINVTVNAAPTASTISANGATTFCSGNTLTLTGNVGGTWNTGATTTSINVIASGNYFVTNANGCGSVNSNIINVVVNPLPTPAVISANGATTFCSGNTLTLTGNVGGTWNTGATTTSINVIASGNYFVTNANSCGSVSSNSINVTVNPLPIAATISAIGATSICSGNSVQLIGNINGVWSDGNTSPSIVVTTSGTYYVINTNGCGNSTSNQIIVTVLPATPIPTITQVGYNLESTIGYNSYQWFNNNFPIPNETNATFTPISSGNYYVLVVDSNGCQAQSAVYNFVYVGELEIASATELILSPNPANSFVLLSTTNKQELKGTLIVWSVNGDLMLQQNLITSNQLKIDIEQWANGMYMLQLIGTNKTENFKFIKQQ